VRRSQLLKGLINFDPDGRQFREDVRQLIKAAKEGKSADEVLKKQAEDGNDRSDRAVVAWQLPK